MAKGITPELARLELQLFAMSRAIFDGGVRGFMGFTQDEYGDTYVISIFTDELINPPYQFYISDSCENVIRNITKYLNVEYADNGSKPFSAKLNNFNLDCDKNGILFTNCNSQYHLKKRANIVEVAIYDDGNNYAEAPISPI
ncbi:977_t:CDS:2 [Dentiscutata erythropus]|uniref:977_t:CDS:1 n=1 Tax=Dentiscutata erythropus TaxID=1348616 RepID=A0A9N9CRZ7_9GLOM|nr:977_t:CDS:2 [Dentiscutata erythropus]